MVKVAWDLFKIKIEASKMIAIMIVNLERSIEELKRYVT